MAVKKNFILTYIIEAGINMTSNTIIANTIAFFIIEITAIIANFVLVICYSTTHCQLNTLWSTLLMAVTVL